MHEIDIDIDEAMDEKPLCLRYIIYSSEAFMFLRSSCIVAEARTVDDEAR